MSIQPFKVLTNFRFEVGEAIVNSSKLQDAVDGVAQAADNTFFSLKRIGLGLVTNFGLGATSLMGVLGNAIKASDNLLSQQLKFSSIISGNMDKLSGNIGSYNERLMVSKKILKDIAKDAADFGLPEKQLISFTQQTSAMLVPKGLAGDNFKGARDLSRNLLKSAPTLGVQPGQVGGQLVRMIEGNAGGENTLFRRLNQETSAFQDKLGKAKNAAKAFNDLPLKERFDLLNEGMSQFAQDAEILGANATLFSNLFEQLSSAFTGVNGVLIPFGDALSGPLKGALVQIIELVHTEVREVFKNLGFILKALVPDIESLTINLLQAREAGNDLRSALFLVLIPFRFLGKVLFNIVRFIGVLTIFKFGLTVLARLGTLLFWVFKGLNFLVVALSRFFPVLALAFTVFQLFSRAKAIAAVEDAKKLPGILSKISKSFADMFLTLKIAFAPAIKIFDDLAQKLSIIFSLAYWLDKTVEAFEWMSVALVALIAFTQGFFFAIFQIIENLKAGKILSAFDNVNEAFEAGVVGFGEIVEKARQDAEGQDTVLKNNVNIGTVNISNKFKENLQPDRIAFSLVKQLTSVGQNGTTARNRPLKKVTQ